MNDQFRELYEQVLIHVQNNIIQQINTALLDTRPIHQAEVRTRFTYKIIEGFDAQFIYGNMVPIRKLAEKFNPIYQQFSTKSLLLILQEAKNHFIEYWSNDKCYKEDNYDRILDWSEERLVFQIAYFNAWMNFKESFNAQHNWNDYIDMDIEELNTLQNSFPTEVEAFEPSELFTKVVTVVQEQELLMDYVSSFKILKSKQYNKSFIEIYTQLYYKLKKSKYLINDDETQLMAHFFDYEELHPIDWKGYLFQLVYLLDQLHKLSLLTNDFDGKQDNIASKKIIQHFVLNGNKISERQILNERVNNVERISSNKNTIIEIDTILQNILE